MIQNLFISDLTANVRGDVLSDNTSLGIYATDASVYQIKPLAIVLPRDNADVLVEPLGSHNDGMNATLDHRWASYASGVQPFYKISGCRF